MSQPLFDISGKVEIPLDMLLRWITTLSVLGLSSWKCAADTILCDTTEDCPESTKNCILQRNLFTYDFGKFLPFPNVVSEAAKEKTGCLMILQADPNVVAVSAASSVVNHLTVSIRQRNGIPYGGLSPWSWTYLDMFSFPYCAPGSRQPEVAHQSITWESKRRGSGPLYILRGLKEMANNANFVQGETLWKLNDDGTEIQ
jgi:hypothetical protein